MSLPGGESVRASRPLRVAVIGDPHFVQSDHVLAAGSRLRFDASGEFIPKEPTQHPWSSLLELISQPEAGDVDLVICVGDMSTGGDKVALETAWKHLNELATRMQAEIVACATGNHDVRSRSFIKELQSNVVRNLGEPRGINEALRGLEPPYPVVDLQGRTGTDAEMRRTTYFGDHLVQVVTDRYRLIVYNSCNEHTQESHDYEKGAFPGSAQKALQRALNSSAAAKVNIFVCHHPPSSHGYYGGNDYDFISGGGLLLSALEAHGSWLVLHGHKHHSHLSYAPGGGQSPVVLAASSLSATELSNRDGFRNQFYIIELDAENSDLQGRVRAWDWFHGLGFTRADRKHGGIFDNCGFGLRRSPSEIAKIIAEATHGKLPVTWMELLRARPDLQYILPSDYGLIEKALSRFHGIVVEPDSKDNWQTLAKAAA